MKGIYRTLAGVLAVVLGLSLLLPTAIAVDKAPNVAFVDVDGEPFNLTDYDGEVILLDFMSTTCAPCKKVAQNLVKLYDKGIEGLNIISISNAPWDTSEVLREHAENYGNDWRHTMDTEEGTATREYNAAVLPTLVIIDRDGYVTFRKKGVVDLETLEKEVDAALKGEAEAIDLGRIGLASFAFLAGMAAFFSPCSFPLLPGYITYYFKMGADLRKKREEAVTAASAEGAGDPSDGALPPVVEPAEPTVGSQVATGLKMGSISGLGIVLVYFILGVIVIGLLAVGVAVSGDAITYMKPAVGIILVVLGAITVADITINTGYITAPYRAIRDRVSPRKGPRKPTFNASGLFLYGVGYGSASASCSAPVFLALAVTAVSTGQPQDAIITFVVFLASLWLLMAVVTVFLTVSEEKVKSGLMKHYILIKKVTGVVFLIVGGYLLLEFLTSEGII